MKISFLIRSLSVGGAERQLITLANGLTERGWDISVAVLYPGGALEAELDSRVHIEPIGKRHRWEVATVLFRLWRWIRREKPDVLHSYLVVPNILTGFLGAVVPSVKVAWGVRASKLALDAYDRLTTLTERASAFFARGADLIIANSEAGRRYCLAAGYPGSRLTVIPNGIDTRRFVPDRNARARLRAAWNIGARETLIGLVGRLDVMKGHEMFLRAAARFSQRHDKARYVCIGDGRESVRTGLRAVAETLGVADRILWLPAGQDMPAVYNALDIICSSSVFGEGFPNVLGEAMACGVPCVATRVGDSDYVVGDTGEIVPPADPEAICLAWERMLTRIAREGEYLSRRCRERILACFTHEHLLDRTTEALERLVQQGRPGPISKGFDD